MSKPLTAVVIGAGIGGMSAAIQLQKAGIQVTLVEKNGQLGGKLNLLETQGFKFDLGPSIFTLPQVFRPLFEGDGKTLEDYVPLERVDPQWRNFFEDGTVLDLWERTETMRSELSRLPDAGTAFDDYERFVAYSKQQYDVVERGYLREGLDGFWELIRFYGLMGGREMDWMHSMSGAVNSRVRNQYLRDIFNYFIKYVGSSANDSPGFMNLMPYIQLGFGLWYVKGGLYEFARGFERRLRELGVEVLLQTEATRITQEGDRVSGVELRDAQGATTFVPADFVISNMEVIPASERLLQQTPRQLKRLSRFEPACSGIVLHLGLDREYPQLAHHNFFYSKDQSQHFDRVFHEKRLPDDPTIYLVAPTRTDPSQAPAGCDNIKILPHIPPLQSKRPYTYEDCVALKELCLDKLERMGLTDLRKHIIVEDFWTPFDIEKTYYSNRGSIYGVVCDRRHNFAFKAPKRSADFKNMFFVGGSVNPGGGMPMVSLSGQHVARMILEQIEQ
ncbi:phytoene desaturase family protein [Granulicella cerasi]|uniref:Phytoene desaturase family protein n=1 Tax=Granulicella cerasi TaxID=741063 RepID=A0ABW1Z893_9BACT|nr:phytoene desaturase family protein [Granulicella cerasi]